MYEWKVVYNTLTLDLTNQEDKWVLDSVKGTNPVSATLNETTMIGVDGVTINGTKRNKRNLVFTFFIEGDCEANRDELYEFFTPKNQIRLYCDTPYKSVYIDGIVESCECEIYTQAEVMQISVVCPDPNFKKVESYDVDNMEVDEGITFPLSVEEPIILGNHFLKDQIIIYNNGRTEIGCVIDIELMSDTDIVRVFNADNDKEYLAFKGSFVKGDKIHINTNFRVRDRALLTRDGVTSSLLNKLFAGSTWIKLNTNVKVIGIAGSHYMSINTREEVIGI